MNALDALPDPAQALERLAGERRPLLIGVRHHSPACASAIPALLDVFAPERLLLELPADLQPWLAWLGHPELEAPVALGAVRADRPSALYFYPFADFSPELAAVRWALAHGVEVEAFDRSYAESVSGDSGAEEECAAADDEGAVAASLLRVTGAEDTASLWDALVEARAPGSDPEAVRRAALLFGWALRVDAARGSGVPARDRAREAYMRHRLWAALAASSRVAVVVGTFHAGALLDEPVGGPLPVYSPAAPPAASIATSLVPYAFELFDARSGYPAGIRDPMWQQRVWAAGSRAAVEDALREAVVAVAREVRKAGHAAGVPDASEAVRLALDLARLRGLPAPGRRELLEAAEAALARGEPLGRGRVLARALERVMVGSRRGRLAPGTPRSGLAPHVEALVARLRLPGATVREPTSLRLDPLRSKIDRERHVALQRLGACGVPYAEEEEAFAGAAPGIGRGREADTLTARWRVQWVPATEAMLELAGLRGVTLEQAAEGALRADARRLEDEERLTADARLSHLRAAAECGLPRLATEGLRALMGPFLDEAGLAELVAAHALVRRIETGHVPGLPSEGERAFALPADVRPTELVAAAIRAVEALAGSDRLEDARALLELVELHERTQDPDGSLGDGRLGWALDALARDGSPLMQGAAGAVRVLTRREPGRDFGLRFSSWMHAGDAGALAARVRGTMALGGPLLEADPSFVGPVLERVASLSDEDFLGLLPALRDGFDVLSPAARGRLLEVVGERLPDAGYRGDPRRRGLDAETEDPPELLGRWAAADRAGADAVARAGLRAGEGPVRREAVAGEDARETGRLPSHAAIGARDRWRLILGRERSKLPPNALRAAAALDELYGHGRGEGARRDLGGGGHEAAFPTAREWAAELEALFGASVREEVLGVAAERGRPAALLEMDAETVLPSLALLERVLALKGGVAEGQLVRLRRLVERIVSMLTNQLATRLRPALAGLATPHPSPRPVGPLDLRRTLAANLRTARPGPTGPRIVPERLVFRTRARRSLEWHVVLVVDVSGSMEPSVIYSAMMAAILSALPALDVRFVAFNTEVMDMSERVDDPLGLLLEVSIGGGTYIARALRYARGLLKVPSRSIVVLVSDFEDGGSVAASVTEVRAMVESGAKVLGLAALDDVGKARYERAIAECFVAAGMPVAALTPLELARWIGEQIR